MRILFVSAEYPPDAGGVGDYTRCLAEALAARGHAVAVLTDQDAHHHVNRTDAETQSRDEGVTIFRRIAHWRWGLTAAVVSVADEFGADLIHLQYQTGAYAMHPAINLLPRGLRRRSSALVIVTCHDLRMPYLFPKAGLVRRWVTRQMLQASRAVVVTNSEDWERLEGQGSADPELYRGRLDAPHLLARIPNLLARIPIGSNIQPSPPPGYEREQMRAELGADAQTVLVAYFGLLNRSKGVDLIVEALAGLPAHFKLLIIGGEADAPEDQRYAAELRAQIARLQLSNRITITGQVPQELVSAYLLAADLAALPFRDGASYRRGSLLAVLAHGLPLVTTAPRVPLEPALDPAALLIPAAYSYALSAALRTLAEQPERRNELADQARQLAMQFGWAAIAEFHEKLYRKVLPSTDTARIEI